ncbi:MAG: hypothetical protein LKCHEGNO_02612 [Burkholderiaceae bacterium]|nr:hypothetical protein [Burkholderiaceae bacterium]
MMSGRRASVQYIRIGDGGTVSTRNYSANLSAAARGTLRRLPSADEFSRSIGQTERVSMRSDDPAHEKTPNHSHSIVAGGLLLTS